MNGPMERCTDCGFDPATVSPSDAATATRSYPRRWRALLEGPDDDDPTIVTRQPPSADASALELAAGVAATFDTVADALRKVAAQDTPDVQIDPQSAAPAGSLDGVLADLAAGAEKLAGAIEAVKGEGWERTGLVGGSSLRALDVVRHGVHRATHDLREAERVLDQGRAGGNGRRD